LFEDLGLIGLRNRIGCGGANVALRGRQDNSGIGYSRNGGRGSSRRGGRPAARPVLTGRRADRGREEPPGPGCRGPPRALPEHGADPPRGSEALTFSDRASSVSGASSSDRRQSTSGDDRAPDDGLVFPSYREFGMAMVRGVDPADMLTLFRGLSMDPGSSQIPLPRRWLFRSPPGSHAVGFAMGCRLSTRTRSCSPPLATAPRRRATGTRR